MNPPLRRVLHEIEAALHNFSALGRPSCEEGDFAVAGRQQEIEVGMTRTQNQILDQPTHPSFRVGLMSVTLISVLLFLGSSRQDADATMRTPKATRYTTVAGDFSAKFPGVPSQEVIAPSALESLPTFGYIRHYSSGPIIKVEYSRKSKTGWSTDASVILVRIKDGSEASALRVLATQLHFAFHEVHGLHFAQSAVSTSIESPSFGYVVVASTNVYLITGGGPTLAASKNFVRSFSAPAISTLGIEI